MTTGRCNVVGEDESAETTKRVGAEVRVDVGVSGLKSWDRDSIRNGNARCLRLAALGRLDGAKDDEGDGSRIGIPRPS